MKVQFPYQSVVQTIHCNYRVRCTIATNSRAAPMRTQKMAPPLAKRGALAVRTHLHCTDRCLYNYAFYVFWLIHRPQTKFSGKFVIVMRAAHSDLPSMGGFYLPLECFSSCLPRHGGVDELPDGVLSYGCRSLNNRKAYSE
jgi:hypothetical protein